MSAPEKSHVYKTTLKTSYGLTESMITRLGGPDMEVSNPHYRSGPPATLYLIERVEQWIEENQAEVDAAREKRGARSSRSKAIAEQRATKLLEFAGAAEIVVQPIPDDVWQQASNYYSTRARDYEESGPIGMRGLVAFVRHRLTNYHALLRQIEGRPGSDLAYHAIRERVNQAVEERLAQRTGGGQ